MSVHLRLGRGDRNLLLMGGGLLVVMLIVALLLTPGANEQDHPSTYSSGSRGAKAAYLLLKSSGYLVERWEQSPEELPNPKSTTLLLAEPLGNPTAAEVRAIQQFLEKGGRIITTGVAGSLFLGRVAVLDAVAGLTWKKVAAVTPSAITRAAPEITLAPQAYWSAETFGVPLYGEEDAPLVVHLTVGEGDALWWASPTPLTNAGLREPGNLEFLLACLGGASERRILWDEYFHGHRRSLAASVMQSPVKWLFLQLGVLALAILLTHSRRSGPIVVAASETRLSPLEFVRTLGSLYRHAGAASVAVDIAYQRFSYALTRRLGVAGRSSSDELERAVRDSSNLDAAALGATLRACEVAKDDAELQPKAALALIRSLDDWAAKLRVFASRH